MPDKTTRRKNYKTERSDTDSRNYKKNSPIWSENINVGTRMRSKMRVVIEKSND
jgi:hypothetical protein